MSSHTTADFAVQISGFRREMRGRIRRMLVSLTDGPVWQFLGHVYSDDAPREARNVETYPGIGIYARPPAGSTSAEAIVVQVGGSDNPAAIAMRDEETRAAIAGNVAADETAVFNSQSMILIKSDGTIDVGSGAGMQPTIRADAYRAAEDTLIAAMTTALAAISTYAAAVAALPAPFPATAAAQGTLTTALTTTWTGAVSTFQGAAATFKSQIAKVR